MKLYLIKYSANELDNFVFDMPYPVFYSLDKDKTEQIFERLRTREINNFNQILEKFPEYKDNENYEIYENLEDKFLIYAGNWVYEYIFEEVELDNEEGL